ncbi:unnamed protein product [Didymodactylos carnosus]|uniref:NADAR domain-containing protein n=1 Tax=Didymodactylos carnosus TaxID=1234261 RepID=A0A815NU99_9BILA|nr:unnamed protein product [Didymodactylos carnosus]CAF4312143.1 unnamed protein product [Didymodactylos carnosus]
MVDGHAHSELDNFEPCKFKVESIEYYSAENYYQCQKTTTPEDHEKVRKSGCGADVWRVGSHVKIKPNWESIKVNQMYLGNKAKFEQNEHIAKQLCATKGKITFRGSTAFWNEWNAAIMERIRAEMRQSGEEDTKTIERITKAMSQYEKEH